MLDKLSKRLAYLLRHDVGKIDINGWRKVSDLVLQGFTEQQLEKIVETDAKKRYEFDKDHKNIRAVQVMRLSGRLRISRWNKIETTSKKSKKLTTLPLKSFETVKSSSSAEIRPIH